MRSLFQEIIGQASQEIQTVINSLNMAQFSYSKLGQMFLIKNSQFKETNIMFNNVGTIDRVIRLVVASVLFYVGLAVYGGSTLGIGLTFVGAVIAISSLAGSCMLYGLLGINTRKQNPQQ
ncbi:MAG: DUF2892 domain-containing protein [Xenococcaceae cyanobacterium MO_188.B19]|nr:DUF2892 domain-containing protein [Xenococcaceae cyanobacterium MO_188.B19]